MNSEHSIIRNTIIKPFSWLQVQRILNFVETIRLERLKKRIGCLCKAVLMSEKLFVQAPENLEIEDYVSFARNVKIIGAGHVKINKETILAPGVVILTTIHDAHALEVRDMGFHKDVVIGQSVWIGTNALILTGVTIHDNSIIRCRGNRH